MVCMLLFCGAYHLCQPGVSTVSEQYDLSTQHHHILSSSCSCSLMGHNVAKKISLDILSVLIFNIMKLEIILG